MNPQSFFTCPTERTTTAPAITVPASDRLRRKIIPGRLLPLLLAAFFASQASVHAEILLSEAFSYDDGPLITASAGKWITDSDTPAEANVAAGVLQLTENKSEDVGILFTSQPAAGAGIYAGFTVKFSVLPSGEGDYFASFRASSGPRFLDRVFATTNGAAAGSLRIAVTTAASTPDSIVPLDLRLGTDYRVVIYSGSAASDAIVWVNPVTEADGGVSSLDSTFPAVIDSFAFRQRLATGNGMGSLTVDDLVVATTFDEVKNAPQKNLWQYTVLNGGVTITRYLGTDQIAVVPETINGLPVTRFTPGIFKFLFPPITSLTLPSGITTIAPFEFQGSDALTNVTFLGPIKAIPNGAFAQCGNLVSVTYPGTVTSIGEAAFSDCSSLKDISLPPSVTQIGARAFWFCSNLGVDQGSFMIPQGVTTIGDQAFRSCDRLEAIDVDPLNAAFTSVDGVLFNKAQTVLIVCPAAKSGTVAIPASVKTLQTSAFAECASLTGVTIPDGVKVLPGNAFAGCSGLTSVALPAGLTSVGQSAFERCRSLNSIPLPAGLTSLGASAFAGSGITDVSLPERITGIPSFAYYNCLNLVSITIPKQITGIGADAFSSCTNLTAITVAELNPAFSSVEGVLFNKARTTLLVYPSGKPGDYQIPGGVRVIGVGAFGRSSLKSLVIPPSVTSLQERAFEDCAQLTTLVIPDTVTSLGVACFQKCSQLASVHIGTGVTTIPSFAFDDCTQLSEVSLSGTVRTLSDGAFSDTPALRSITIPASVRTLGIAVFYGAYSFADESVPLKIYFEGNAPSAGPQALVLSPSADYGPTVYYRAGATGWTTAFARQPAVLWDPQVATGDGAPAVREGKFGFTITGAPGVGLVVEACTDLADPVWVPLGTHTLAGGASPFTDSDGVNLSARYYRFRMP